MKVLLFLFILFPAFSIAETPPLLTDENGNPITRSFDSVADDEQSDSDGGTGTGDTSSDNNNDDDMSDENLNNTNGFETATSGGRENAETSASNSGMTQALGMIMGAAFMSQCNKPPGNVAPCILGAMSFMDAFASGNNKGNSINFEQSLLPDAGDTTTDGGTTPEESEILAQEAAAELKKLEGMGFVSNSDGSVVAPDGQTYTGGDFANKDALVNKGFSSDQAQAALDLLKSTSDQAQSEVGAASARGIASVGSGGGGDGGGAAAPLSDLIIDENSGVLKKAGSKNGVGRMPADQAAKLSKNFNGTPIGIDIADLFLIVTKKYEEKKNNSEFINKEY